MIGDRRLRSRRRGITPRKLPFVYCLAFFLVAFHQTERVAEWFDDLALSHEGTISETAFKVSAVLRDVVAPLGVAWLNAYEDRLLSLTEHEAYAALVSGFGVGRDNQNRTALDPDLAPPPLPSIQPTGSSTADGDLYDTPLPPRAASQKRTLTEPPSDLLLGPNMGQPAPEGPAESFRTASLPPPIRRPVRLNVYGTFNPENVLLLGDSMMLEGLGPQLQRKLRDIKGLTVNRAGRYGTGLCRLDVFDWLAYFGETLDKYQPDLVILTLGANDPQDIVNAGKKRVFLGTDEWNDIYADRVAELLRLAEIRGTQVFWVGLPIMGKQPYGRRVAGINEVTSEVCSAAANCRFWDSWLSVADGRGRYATFLRDERGRSQRVRSKDAIHLTEYGGRLMAEKFLAETAAWADFSQANPSGAPTTIEEAPEGVRAMPPSAGEGDESLVEAGVAEYKLFSTARAKQTFFYLAVPEINPDHPGPFPVLLLLHGAWEGADSWIKRLGEETLVNLAARNRVILAMPDGEPFGWYLNGPEAAIETYFIKEFITYLKSLSIVDPDRLGVLGLSMGGHGSLTLTLKHPELFRAVGSMSGITDLAVHAGNSHPVNRQLKIDRVLGPAGPEGRAWAPHSAMTLTRQNQPALAGKPTIITVSSGDRLTLAENRAYHQLLNDLELEHVYREDPGGHDWDYWAAVLPIQVEFLAKALRED